VKSYAQKIVPHLWFDQEAKEAAEFYCALFPEAQINNIATLYDTPSGDCDVVSFELWGYAFMAISAGPLFKINPSISFFVNFDPSRDKEAKQRLEAMWAKLSAGGKALMPLDTYPFSARYGWVEDKYGVSWQLILTNPEGDERPPIIPSLLFVGDRCGQAEEAMNFYMSVFKNAKQGLVARYPQGMEPDQEGSLMFADFRLDNQWFAAMDSAHAHAFTFNEAVSLMVHCETQAEIDAYWAKLSAVPEAEQCGWLKDKYGVSWQIVPTALGEMLGRGTPEQINRVTQAFLPMKKFDLARLKQAYEQE
jgi:predicted 3-demethylubiquinone-9 3-methyltransferase (glyoxalase superfamily)